MLLLAASISICHAEEADIQYEDCNEITESMSQEDDDTITRAVNTVCFNNVLIEGNAKLLNNLIVEGLITGTLMGDSCSSASGPLSSTLNAIARYSNTTGTRLANSGVTFNSNTVSGISTFSCESATVETFITTGGKSLTQQVSCDQAIQVVPLTGVPQQTATALNTTSILLLTSNQSETDGFTLVFPPTPANGQLFTVACTSILNNTGQGTFDFTAPGGATVVNPLPAFGVDQAAQYVYYAPDNAWYAIGTTGRVVS